MVLERRGSGELSLLPLCGVGGLSVRRLLIVFLRDESNLGETQEEFFALASVVAREFFTGECAGGDNPIPFVQEVAVAVGVVSPEGGVDPEGCAVVFPLGGVFVFAPGCAADAEFEEGFPGLGVADGGFADGAFDGGFTCHGVWVLSSCVCC